LLGNDAHVALERIPIARLDRLDAMRTDWDALVRDDPHATLFTTFGWIRAFLESLGRDWTILTLRRDGELIAALPVAVHGAPHPRIPVARALRFAAAPFADYNGMLCRPHDEALAIAELAAMVRELPWDRAAFEDAHDPRVAELIARLNDGTMDIVEAPPSPCSAIALPPEWETFLATLSKATRRAITRPFKMLGDEVPAVRVSSATTAEDAATHVDAVLDVNALRWGTTRARREAYRRLFLAAFAHGCARADVIWDGARPIAGGLSFVDRERGTCGLYMVGHDPEYGRFSPGKALLATAVRQAIADGYRTFDFMRGGEAYKQSFATHEAPNSSFAIRRHGARDALLHAIEPGYAAVRQAFVRIAMPRRAA
jgi:CelD/BcsL family acetyltransferase involved in cellulose biosynthesis